MKTFRLFWVVVACLVATSAFADSRARAITITTDAFAGNFAIDVTRASNGAVTSMIFIGPNNPNGAVLSLKDLSQGPKLIFNSQGHDVIFLSLESDFNAQKGGHLDVRFLTNGITGNYKDFRVLVDVEKSIILRSDPNSNDPESDDNSYTSVFNHLFMEKNTFFGQILGIGKIVPSLQ